MSDDAKLQPVLLTRQQAADLLQVSPHTVRTWCATGSVQLPNVRLGKHTRFPRDELMQFIANRTTRSA